MIERRTYRISGRVQGVGFRWYTRHAASDLGVGGTVRNAPDGTVEVVAIADPETLTAFEDRLRSGPPTASVEALEMLERTEEPGEDEAGDFRIVR